MLLAAAVGPQGGTLAQAPPPVPQGLERFEYTRLVMGVRARVVLYAASEPAAERAANLAYDRLNTLDAALSDYRVDSELNRLCAAPPGRPVRLSEDLFAVLERAGQIASSSGGAFDPTVGPVVRLWREARRSHTPPARDALAAARAVVGHNLVRLDPEARTATLSRAGMQLDLGGVAKGYAAHEAVKTLTTAGHPASLVELGGDIALGDPPPGEDGWSIRIATGLGDERTVLLENASVATSSGAVQFVEIGGVRYSHIIDPRTATPLTDAIGVSVIARDGATADALASAVSVLGSDAGLKLVDATADAEALVARSADGELRVTTSRGFPAPGGAADSP